MEDGYKELFKILANDRDADLSVHFSERYPNVGEYWIVSCRDGKTVARKNDDKMIPWLGCQGQFDLVYNVVTPIRKLTEDERKEWFNSEGNLLRRAIPLIASVT